MNTSIRFFEDPLDEIERRVLYADLYYELRYYCINCDSYTGAQNESSICSGSGKN